MGEEKILCSADEHAWLEKVLNGARFQLAWVTKAVPGSIAHSKISFREQDVRLCERELATFEVRSGSVRSGSEDHYELSPEFQDVFGSLLPLHNVQRKY